MPAMVICCEWQLSVLPGSHPRWEAPLQDHLLRQLGTVPHHRAKSSESNGDIDGTCMEICLCVFSALSNIHDIELCKYMVLVAYTVDINELPKNG